MPAINQCGYGQRWQELIEKYMLNATTVEINTIAEACM
jgi:hypothetical protein